VRLARRESVSRQTDVHTRLEAQPLVVGQQSQMQQDAQGHRRDAMLWWIISCPKLNWTAQTIVRAERSEVG